MTELVAKIKQEMKDCGLSQSQLSKEIKVSTTQISQYLSGKYIGDVSRLEAKISNFFQFGAESIEKNELNDNEITINDNWQQTVIGNRMKSAMVYAYESVDFSFISTPPGMGKTVTAKDFKNNNDNVYMVTFGPHHRSVNKVIQEIAYACGAKFKDGADNNLNFIKDCLVVDKSENKRICLIADEVQHLSPVCLDFLRVLHDFGIAVIVMGNPDSYKNVKNGAKKYDFSQFYSRIGVRVVQEKPSDQDVASLLKGWGISDEGTHKFAKKIARTGGALRAVHKCLSLANTIATRKGESLSLTHVEHAHANLSWD